MVDSARVLMAEIERHQPNVVVLERGTCLSELETLAKALVRFPELRVIVVSEQNNWLHIYSKEEILVTQATNLVSLFKMGVKQPPVFR